MDENLTMSFEEQQKKRQEQMLVYGQELRERQEQIRERQEQERQRGAAIFGGLAAASLVYTIIYTFCMYKNVSGITAPVWVFATIGYVNVVFRMFGISRKRGSIFIMTVMGLLGISCFLTGNEWIIWLNDMAVFLLLVALLLHNFGVDENWDIGKYLGEITVAVFGAVGCIGKPFSDGNVYFKSRQQESKGRGRYIAVGIGIAIPCVLFLGLLLATADMVFANMLEDFFSMFRFPTKLFGILFMLLFGFFSSYCGVRFVESHAGAVTVTDKKRGEPLIAITVTFMIALLYLLFCGIQIGYLFVGNMQLPKGVTYAEYARSGFFQLLFVCVLNLILVLAIKKYFRENRFLNALLLVISGCTFVMTASSAWRMILYIKAYQLTFLRVAVLVALFAIALLLAGIVAMILRPEFPLLRYGLAVVCVVYLAFSFSHVDYFIASYNLSHANAVEACTGDAGLYGNATDAEVYSGDTELYGNVVEQTADYGYIYTLSTDAAPAIAAYLGKCPGTAEPEAEGCGEGSSRWLDYYLSENRHVMEHFTLRNFNVSHYVAYRLLGK